MGSIFGVYDPSEECRVDELDDAGGWRALSAPADESVRSVWVQALESTCCTPCSCK